MGDFNEHLLFGFLSAAVVAYFAKDWMNFTPLQTMTSAIFLAAGSVLPDIDHKKAYVHRAAKSFLSISLGLAAFVLLPFQVQVRFIVASAVIATVYLGISRVKMRHRGFTHSISFASIVASIGVIIGVMFFSTALPGIALGLGLLSHLALDGEFKLE